MDVISHGAMHYSNLTGGSLEELLRASHKFPVGDKKGKHSLHSHKDDTTHSTFRKSRGAAYSFVI